jgi:cell fate regulator YaaT (PSP1 superfamily)
MPQPQDEADRPRRGRSTRPRTGHFDSHAEDGGQPEDQSDDGRNDRCVQESLGRDPRRQQREQEAYRIGLLKIRERGLPMKLTRVEYSSDLSRLVFYFTAEGRVDFRELVKELAAEFRMRIEMRQIGVRDEARLLGGYGSCGRPLCCSAWLVSFEPVSIRMAKQQDLTLNPTKLSGLCGRLKCCLRYELSCEQLSRRNGKAVDSNGETNGELQPDDDLNGNGVA